MSDIGRLKEAFLNFTEASKSLETYYGRIQEQVNYLTREVEEKNRQLEKDITRIKELEAWNERNHRLIAMGEMAAKIVHEIRSPLCSVELYASMLARDLEGTQHLDMAKGISTGISSLNNILTNMLFFAKPQKPLLRPVEICRLLEETVFMLMPMLESRGLKFIREIGQGVSVRGDADLLKQVFLNILLNAIQATPEDRAITANCRNEGQSALIEISDEGPGIEAENIEKIFDPFFSTKEKGTGLGLAISAKIVQAHGGTIKVMSIPGHGAMFRLSFPENSGASLCDTMGKEGIFL